VALLRRALSDYGAPVFSGCAPAKGCGRALVQKRVYPRRIWRATFCLKGHLANREQQSEFGVDHLGVAHAAELSAVASEVPQYVGL
jgi:hypothetical protein